MRGVSSHLPNVRGCKEGEHRALVLTIGKKEGKQPLGTCGKNNWNWRSYIQQGTWLPNSAGSAGRCGMNSGLWRALRALSYSCALKSLGN